MSRKRGSSLGKMDFGDTQGSSLTTARVENTRRARRMSRSAATSGSKSESGIPGSSSKSTAPQGLAVTLLRLCSRHTWLSPLVVMSYFLGWWVLSARHDPSHWLNACIKLSYPEPEPFGGAVQYGKGPRDFAFLAFYVIVFTFLREFFMQVALRPLARYFGIRRKHKINRFVEQTYALIYYGIVGPLGLFIMKYKCPALWYFRTTGFYEDFPHRTSDLWLKAFYMLQASFWAQQALVLILQLEKRRRDFRELVFHHVVTVALIFLSYRFHFMRMGLAVYITMDVSDFFLAASKTLNYLGSPLQVPFFATFVAVWTYLRHYINIIILISIWTEFKTVGPFELNWETQQYKCWISQYITFALLLALQLVNLYWYGLILRIAYRAIVHSARSDVRSDDEDEDDEEE